MLMQIAAWSDRIGGNASNLSRLLPPDYNTIDKITRLDEITFKRLVKDGTICPTLQRNEVSKMQLPPDHAGFPVRGGRRKRGEGRVVDAVSVVVVVRLIDPATFIGINIEHVTGRHQTFSVKPDDQFTAGP